VPALEVRGATLSYRMVGQGPPLVLVHGSGTDQTTWDGVVGELARARRVVTYDRPSLGCQANI